MKRYLLLPLALAGLTHAGQFFSGKTSAQGYAASIPQNTYSTGKTQWKIYASGPNSGTWGATVHVYQRMSDTALALIATFTLTQAGPNIDVTGTRSQDMISLNMEANSVYYADITNVTGTIPATGFVPGLLVEQK
jgi:hypothetical protein